MSEKADTGRKADIFRDVIRDQFPEPFSVDLKVHQDGEGHTLRVAAISSYHLLIEDASLGHARDVTAMAAYHGRYMRSRLRTELLRLADLLDDT